MQKNLQAPTEASYRHAAEQAESLVPQLDTWIREHTQAVQRINEDLDEQAAILKRLAVLFPFPMA
jgi:hypothetical protein